MAMLLMKKIGRPRVSAAYGIMEPNGNPANFRECVERLPIRASETRVWCALRARVREHPSGGSGAGVLSGRHASMLAKCG